MINDEILTKHKKKYMELIELDDSLSKIINKKANIYAEIILDEMDEQLLSYFTYNSYNPIEHDDYNNLLKMICEKIPYYGDDENIIDDVVYAVKQKLKMIAFREMN